MEHNRIPWLKDEGWNKAKVVVILPIWEMRENILETENISKYSNEIGGRKDYSLTLIKIL